MRARGAARLLREAGGIVTRRRGGGGATEILLITAKGRPDQWIVPKGHVEPGELVSQAALREVEEEAGVRGELVGYLGRFTFRLRRWRVQVRCYLIQARSPARAREGRKHRWCSFGEAVARLSFAEVRALLKRHRRQITGGGGGAKR